MKVWIVMEKRIFGEQVRVIGVFDDYDMAKRVYDERSVYVEANLPRSEVLIFEQTLNERTGVELHEPQP